MTFGRRWRRGSRPSGMGWLPLVLALVVLHLAATTFVDDGEAHACSCADFTFDTALAQADAAFVGTAVERRMEGQMGSWMPVVITFDVLEVVKGELPGRVEVWTGEGDGDCGITVRSASRSASCCTATVTGGPRRAAAVSGSLTS